MENKQEDRRSRRSRKLLKQGLLELMKEKRFSAISVRNVTDRMDLNRGTFYLHYPDTTALLRSLEEDMLAEGWRFAYDLSVPSCRLLNQPYDPADTENTQYYVIDGFILSPNVELLSVEGVDLDFADSDHNPVLTSVKLK